MQVLKMINNNNIFSCHTPLVGGWLVVEHNKHYVFITLLTYKTTPQTIYALVQ